MLVKRVLGLAGDLVQDTFVNAYRYLQSYDSRWRFSTWLYRIALRNAARHSREVILPVDPGSAQPDLLQQCIEHAERENLWLTAKKLQTVCISYYDALFRHLPSA